MKIRNPALLTLLLLSPLAPHAQEPEPEPVAEITFSVFPLEPGNWAGIYYAPEGLPEEKAVELSFNPHERSIQHDYKGPSPLRFFRKSTDAEGNEIFQTVAALPLAPEKRPHPVILFFEPESAPDTYALSVMEDSKNTFPDESIVFFNTMNITFHGILGEERLTLPPGVSAPVSVETFFVEPAPIVLAIEQDNDLHLVLRNKIRFAPERKTLMILRKPKNPNSLRIRTQRLTEFTGDRGGDDDPGA